MKFYKNLKDIHTGDIEIGKVLELPENHISSLTTNRFLVFSACYDRTAICWDLEAETPIRTFTGHTRPVWCIDAKYNTDGSITLATGAVDNTIRIWDVDSCTCHHILQGHRAAVRCIQFFTKGNEQFIASGSYDNFVFIWKDNSINQKLKHKSTVICLQVFERNNTTVLATSCFDGNLYLYDVELGVLLRTFSGHVGGVFSMHVAHDMMVSGGKDRTVRVWDLDSEESIRVIDLETVTSRVNGVQLVVAQEQVLVVLAFANRIISLQFR